MNWSDEGIVLSTRKHGENAAIVTLMTRAYGRYAGLVRGGSGSRARGIYQTGNLVTADWRARLSEHLGSYTCELLQPHAALLMTERQQLMALLSATALVERLLPEREPHPEVFENLKALITVLEEDVNWPSGYALWEAGFLNDLGYGLDLSQCAATGSREDLVYVSPRTGCAVSASAGEPYKDKLFPLPAFLLGRGEIANTDEILQAFRVTGHFLNVCARDVDGGGIPEARVRFLDRFSRS